jgi:hypothetical protein
MILLMRAQVVRERSSEPDARALEGCAGANRFMHFGASLLITFNGVDPIDTAIGPCTIQNGGNFTTEVTQNV